MFSFRIVDDIFLLWGLNQNLSWYGGYGKTCIIELFNRGLRAKFNFGHLSFLSRLSIIAKILDSTTQLLIELQKARAKRV